MGRVASELAISLGLEWDSGDFTALAGALGTGFRFQTFLAVLESKYSDNVVEEIGLVEAVHELYHTLLHDVLKKVKVPFIFLNYILQSSFYKYVGTLEVDDHIETVILFSNFLRNSLGYLFSPNLHETCNQ